MILDETLYADGLQKLLKPGGQIIVNTRTEKPEWKAFDGDTLAKSLRLPVVNTVMLGALSGVSGVVSVSDLETAIEGYLAPKIREKNKLAVAQAAKEAAV